VSDFNNKQGVNTEGCICFFILWQINLYHFDLESRASFTV